MVPLPLPPEARSLLIEWLPTNDDPDRPQITLSTVAADGGADARTVLLTEFDDTGFYFHTDARSRKVAEIATHPGVAFTILWPGFTRQIVIRGSAEVASPGEISTAYARRSPYLKQLAWQNSVEFAQLPIDERREQWAAFTAAHADGFEQPEGWIGFLVRPTQLTFWTSNPDAPSRREEFTLAADGWTHGFLAG